MSQHHFATTHQGRPVNVVLGFDRPLQGFFCIVERQDTDEDDFLYCNLDDPRLAPTGGMAGALGYFYAVLGDLGLHVPASMFEQTELDCRSNAGNRMAVHRADGGFD